MTKTVADVMTPNPIAVKPQTPLQEVIKILAGKKISGLPVVNDAGKLVGAISDTDLMWQESGVDPPPYFMFLDSVIYLQNPARHNQEIHKALGQTVAEVMTVKPITVTADRSVKQAAHLMNEKKIGRLFVIEPQEEQLVGIITRGDIIRIMANS